MIRLLIVSAAAAVAAIMLTFASSEPARAQGCGFNEFDAEFRQLTTNYPQQNSWGARDTYQYSHFLGIRGIEILNRHRPCMRPEDYQANYDALAGMRDQGLRGCQQLSTNPNSCVPQYPGSEASAPQPSATCGFQAFDNEFRQLTTNYPQRNSWGARDTYQYSYFLGVRGLQILDRHRPCMSGPDFEANRSALAGMQDQGLRGCQQLSTSSSSCVPEYPNR